MYTATYDPADDKLRLSSATRLDAETYARVKAAGFIWAPKQQIFVAPMWTPEREDLLLELCGEIGDEDTSLVERAEQRAERFEKYSDSRRADAEQAKAAVDRIADGIPFGQPILVGHHSERHARKDAEKIENGMRRAVKMWDTAQYWQSRARGAIRAAKYKERPDVRARRIKGLEADKRKQEQSRKHAETCLAFWSQNDLTREQALRFTGSSSGGWLQLPRKEGDKPGHDGNPTAYDALSGENGANYYATLYAPRTLKEVIEAALAAYQRSIVRCDRWIQHYENRLAYERAMMAESGGTPDGRPKAAGFDLQVGGRVMVGRDWLTVTKVNRKGGEIVSVSTNARYVRVRGIEEIQDYQAATVEQAEQVKAATKQLPLVNFRAPGCVEMTTAQWKEKTKYGGSAYVTEFNEKGTEAKHGMIGEGAAVYRQRAVNGKDWVRVPVFLTDAKVTAPPQAAEVEPTPSLPPVEHVDQPEPAPQHVAPKPTEFDAIRESLKAGVQVVSAPQLFPTPPELAARMAEELGVQDGQCVLEPSAGTGNLVRAVLDRVDTEVLGYEISPSLCSHLSRTFPSYKLAVRCNDFLTVTDFQGCYERIIMNPPFENGADIKHIEHAVKFLKPGGRLVAICANGPRQRDKLKPMAENSGGWWEDLPAGTFKEQGTGVNTALLVYEAPKD